jgi:hypothetical protein
VRAVPRGAERVERAATVAARSTLAAGAPNRTMAGVAAIAADAAVTAGTRDL